jgi:hypothetical protein
VIAVLHAGAAGPGAGAGPPARARGADLISLASRARELPAVVDAAAVVEFHAW